MNQVRLEATSWVFHAPARQQAGPVGFVSVPRDQALSLARQQLVAASPWTLRPAGGRECRPTTSCWPSRDVPSTPAVSPLIPFNLFETCSRAGLSKRSRRQLVSLPGKCRSLITGLCFSLYSICCLFTTKQNREMKGNDIMTLFCIIFLGNKLDAT